MSTTSQISQTNNFNTNTKNNGEWLTPPYVLDALGEFDLDPCSPVVRPWDTAKGFDQSAPISSITPFADDKYLGDGQIILSLNDEIISLLETQALPLTLSSLINANFCGSFIR